MAEISQIIGTAYTEKVWTFFLVKWMIVHLCFVDNIKLHELFTMQPNYLLLKTEEEAISYEMETSTRTLLSLIKCFIIN